MSGMTCTDLIEIIKACDSSDVSSLKLEGVEIVFKSLPNKETSEYIDWPTEPIYEDGVANESEKDYTGTDDIDEGEDITEDELIFTDPVAWEAEIRGDINE